MDHLVEMNERVSEVVSLFHWYRHMCNRSSESVMDCLETPFTKLVIYNHGGSVGKLYISK